jgi:glyoxylase-like metal-dependent hydrolase (beta-lactamase superfamily II)
MKNINSRYRADFKNEEGIKMYELIQAGERTYYIQCPAKIGIYRINDQDVYLIDSGGDKDAGRRVKKILDQNGWMLKGILNTHSNADHIGGNRYLQQQYHCKVFADGIEAAFTKHPVLEPSFLYGGYPFQDLRHKFLMAAESDVSCFDDVDFPKGIEVIALPGHFFDMVGFRTLDNVVFLADCLSSPITLEKYQLSFIYDVAAYLKTLDMVKGIEARLFIPSHAEVVEDIGPLAEINQKKVYEIAKQIKIVCNEPLSFEAILQKLFGIYKLTMTYEQYVLIGSTLRSYLAWMKDSGELESFFEDNLLLWKNRIF